MSLIQLPQTRRQFIQRSAFGAALFSTPGLFAEQLSPSAQMTEGPFYPDKLPLDTDNDLLIINDSLTPAVGEITHLTGRVLSQAGEPIRNAFVEVWQVDAKGVYLHSGSAGKDKADSNFQGYGRFLTDVKGNYYFRTIKPVLYPGRTPHIHIAVSRNGHRMFTSQILIKGNAQNDKDFLYKAIKDDKLKQTVLADFQPIKGSKFGELAANFDIVLGQTAQDDDMRPTGGVAKPVFRRRRRR